MNRTLSEGVADARVAVEYDATDLLHVEDTDHDGNVYVSRPDVTPLDTASTHATITATTDNGRIGIKLNGETLDAVIDALHDIQQFHSGSE